MRPADVAIIRSAAGKLHELAAELKMSHTYPASRQWPPGEEDTKAEYDNLIRQGWELLRIADQEHA